MSDKPRRKRGKTPGAKPSPNGQPKPSPNGHASTARRNGKKSARVPLGNEEITLSRGPLSAGMGDEHADALPAVSASEVHRMEHVWLSPGRIPLGAFWLLDGNKGTGKSTLAASIAAAVTGGPALPGGARRAWGSVLWFPGEEDLGDVRGKLISAGANVMQVCFPGRGVSGETVQQISIPAMEERLEATVRAHKAKMVLFDTLSCFAGGADLNQEQPARSVTSPLTRIAQATGALILAIRHPRKTPVSNPLDRGMGNPAIAAAARGVLTTGKDPDSGRRVLGLLATNKGKGAQTICYEIVDVDGYPAIQWGPEIALDPDRIEFGVVEESVEMARVQATQLLRKRIGNVWVPAADVLAEAKKNGISPDALDRARAKLGVPTKRVGKIGSDGHWEWGPPEGGWPAGM